MDNQTEHQIGAVVARWLTRSVIHFGVQILIDRRVQPRTCIDLYTIFNDEYYRLVLIAIIVIHLFQLIRYLIKSTASYKYCTGSALPLFLYPCSICQMLPYPYSRLALIAKSFWRFCSPNLPTGHHSPLLLPDYISSLSSYLFIYTGHGILHSQLWMCRGSRALVWALGNSVADPDSSGSARMPECGSL